MRPHGSQEHLERRRRRAIELLRKGLILSAVAAKVGSSVSAVFGWRERFRAHGEHGRNAKRVAGRPARLSRPHSQTLTLPPVTAAVSCGSPPKPSATHRWAE